MHLEPEWVPILLGAILVITALELAVGLYELKSKPAPAKYALVGHAVSMMLGFLAMLRTAFSSDFTFPNDDNVTSVFGMQIFFFGISVIFLVKLIRSLK